MDPDEAKVRDFPFIVDGEHVALASVNGIGEIRWGVTKQDLEFAIQHQKESWFKSWSQDAEYINAAKHFGIIK